ncbi:unnamed protein product [Chrysodeixis includens]|uniref:Uncharacterized protein n=1 Tax=Chrysodeixis includens TaxID=689277 RepID=A0A9N8L0K2_CHRIL|nr:unnamed protein product [Chrysodeixis includens]
MEQRLFRWITNRGEQLCCNYASSRVQISTRFTKNIVPMRILVSTYFMLMRFLFNNITAYSRVFIGIARLVSDPTGVLNHELTYSVYHYKATQQKSNQCKQYFYNNFCEDDSYLKRYNGLLTRIYRDSPTSFGPNRSQLDNYAYKT